MASECTLAECLAFFDDALATLRTGFESIEAVAPKPKTRVRAGHYEVRYDEPTVELALFLKLARIISLLGALRIMVERGMIQEQGILKRAIDETDEDILFLSFGHQNGMEDIHHQFLDAFWAEEFEDPTKPLKHTRRESLPRRKIQAWNSRLRGIEDPSTAQSVDRLLQGVFSGYVHGASPHIMDLYDPVRQRFCLAGLPDSPVRDSYIVDSANYPYRALMAAVMVSRRLGLEEVADGLYAKVKEAEAFVDLPTEKEAAALASRLRSK
jgi:hypothetical protein